MKSRVLALLIIAIGSVNSFSTSAQSIERKVISPFGFSFSGSTVQSDCTMGEVSTATLGNGDVIITQGFHQPSIIVGSCLGDFDFNPNQAIEQLHPNFADECSFLSLRFENPARILQKLP
ncbi:MAG: hypothetical protein SGI87_12140 [Flavobacteriales bacterium]|nr:hypothetical protein [Flavobacteriales bacterium]